MKKSYLIIGGVVALFAVGGWYAMKQVNLIDYLSYSIDGYKVRSVSKEGAKIDITLVIRNEGALKVNVKNFKFNVFANDKFLATAVSSVPMEIKANDSVKTVVQVLLNPKLMIQNIGSVLQGSSASGGWRSITLKIDGGLNINQAGIPFYVPVIYGFKLADFTESPTV